MNYYRIWPATDISELGKDPQVLTVVYPSVDMPRMHWHKIRKDSVIDFDLKLPNVLLDPKAKFTDFLRVGEFSGVFVCVSDEFAKLLESHRIDKCQMFPFEAIRGASTRVYNAIYFIQPRTGSFIDWTKSVFHKWQAMGHVWREQLMINSIEEFTQINDRIKAEEKLTINFKNLVLNEEVINVDFFRLSSPVHGYFVSERLKLAFEAHKFTGMKFESIDEINEMKANLQPWPGYGQE